MALRSSDYAGSGSALPKQEIGVQANWKNPEPLVLKYTRSRSSLPALMVKELVAEVAKDFVPQCALEEDVIDDAEDREATLTEFFVKAPEKGSSYEYRFHVCSANLWKRSRARGRSHQSSCTLARTFRVRRCYCCASSVPKLGPTFCSPLRHKMEEDPSKIPEIPAKIMRSSARFS